MRYSDEDTKQIPRSFLTHTKTFELSVEQFLPVLFHPQILIHKVVVEGVTYLRTSSKRC